VSRTRYASDRNTTFLFLHWFNRPFVVSAVGLSDVSTNIDTFLLAAVVIPLLARKVDLMNEAISWPLLSQFGLQQLTVADADAD